MIGPKEEGVNILVLLLFFFFFCCYCLFLQGREVMGEERERKKGVPCAKSGDSWEPNMTHTFFPL